MAIQNDNVNKIRRRVYENFIQRFISSHFWGRGAMYLLQSVQTTANSLLMYFYFSFYDILYEKSLLFSSTAWRMKVPIQCWWRRKRREFYFVSKVRRYFPEEFPKFKQCFSISALVYTRSSVDVLRIGHVKIVKISFYKI